MRTSLIAVLLLLLASFAAAQSQPQLNLMPMPASVQPGSGQLAIKQSFSVANTGVHDASLDGEVQRFVTQLSRQTGIPFRPKPGARADAGDSRRPWPRGRAETWRGRILRTDRHRFRREADRADYAWRPARAADISSAGANHSGRIRRARRHHQRSASLSPGAAC